MWRYLVALLAGVAFGLWLISDDNFDSIKGKRVLVTGASGGIGEFVAYEYARHGANVVVTARRQEELNRVTEKCRRLAPSNSSITHKAIVADMKDSESIGNMVKQAVDQLGGLDIVVLNHIIKPTISIIPFNGDREGLERVHSTMDINFRSYVETAALAMPHLTDSEGVLVVVNSIMGHMPHPKMAPYVASKFALNGFFNSLRGQFVQENRNVAVTSCVLGLIDTHNALDSIEQSGSATLRYLKPASVEGAAKAIVAGSGSRSEVIYFPNWSTWFYVRFLINNFPSLVDVLVRMTIAS